MLNGLEKKDVRIISLFRTYLRELKQFSSQRTIIKYESKRMFATLQFLD
jgi:hypothetical protein